MAWQDETYEHLAIIMAPNILLTTIIGTISRIISKIDALACSTPAAGESYIKTILALVYQSCLDLGPVEHQFD